MPKEPPIEEPDARPEGEELAHVPPAGFSLFRLLQGLLRNSPWVVIAVAIHGILIAVLSVLYIRTHRRVEEAPPTTVGIAAKKEEKIEPPVDVKEVIDRMAIPKNEEREVVSYDEEVYIPASEAAAGGSTADPSLLALLPGREPGTAIGVGEGGRRGSRPSPFSGRRAGSNTVGRKEGPTEQTRKAVLDGLTWLIRHQHPDGHWAPDKLQEICLGDKPCISKSQELTSWHTEGITGLALLAFLGAGYSHESKQFVRDKVTGKDHRFGDVIRSALQWLVKRQKPDGSFTETRPYMYNEALASMALSEAYGLTRNRYFKDPAQKAVNLLMNAQRPHPAGKGLWGWRYAARGDIEARRAEYATEAAFRGDLHQADTSVTAWVVMALKSAELSELAVSRASYEGAMDFVRWATVGDGLVGYLDPKTAGLAIEPDFPTKNYLGHPTMVALGMCIRTFSEHNLDDPFLDLGARHLVKDLPAVTRDRLSLDYYYWYYATLALNQFDGPDSPRRTGKYWGPWNEAMKKAVLEVQDQTEKSCGHGGWLIPDKWGYHDGALYATAINVLTLEVYYRYENAFGGARRK